MTSRPDLSTQVNAGLRAELRSLRTRARLFDFLFLFLNVQFLVLLFRNQPRFDPITLLVIPAVLFPFYAYAGSRFFRQTFGQYLFSLERVKKKDGEAPTRLYDWLFESKLRNRAELSGAPWLAKFSLLAALILSSGVLFLLQTNDPVTKKWKVVSVPADQDFFKQPSIVYLPFFYALTPIPASTDGEPLLWELPYIEGPPKTFVKRVEIRWSEELQHRLTFSGPLSFPEVRTQEAFVECLQRPFGCGKDRRELFNRHLKLFAEFEDIFETSILRVENPLLKPKEMPTLLYVRGTSKKDQTRRLEMVLLLNPNLRYQTISLEQKDSPVAKKNSDFFRSLVSNIRVTDDLAAPRAWVNEKLAGFALKGAPTLPQITEGQKLLLSKISVDPSTLEPFYHLFQFSEVEYRMSFQEKNLVSTARARRLMTALVAYAKDIAKDDPKTKEMEQTLAQIDQRTK